MQAWRIKLISTDGKNIYFKQASIRLLAAVVSAGCFGLGYFGFYLKLKIDPGTTLFQNAIDFASHRSKKICKFDISILVVRILG